MRALLIVSLLAAGASGCDGEPDERRAAELRPVAHEETERSKPAAVAPSPPSEAAQDEGGDVPPGKVPPEPEQGDGEGDDAAPEPGDSSAQDGVKLRTLRSACGGSTVGRDAPATRIGSRRDGGSLRVDIRDLDYYCDPPPRFTARVRGNVLLVRVLKPRPGAPVTRCTCASNATLSIDGADADTRRVRLVHDDGRVLATRPIGRGVPPPAQPPEPSEGDTAPAIPDPWDRE